MVLRLGAYTVLSDKQECERLGFRDLGRLHEKARADCTSGRVVAERTEALVGCSLMKTATSAGTWSWVSSKRDATQVLVNVTVVGYLGMVEKIAAGASVNANASEDAIEREGVDMWMEAVSTLNATTWAVISMRTPHVNDTLDDWGLNFA